MGNMKANRKFIEADDNAVSAVIGVILMVAITVAIAATVYVYVSGMIGSSPETTPNMQMVKDSTNKKLTIASADPGNLQWSDFDIKYNGTAATYGATNQSFSYPTSAFTGNVEAGQYLTLRYIGTITIRHEPTNTLIGTWEFN